jgi:hypothetical protein
VDMINLEESGVKWNAKPPRGEGREDEAGIWACRMEEKSFIRLGLIWPSAYKLKGGVFKELQTPKVKKNLRLFVA